MNATVSVNHVDHVAVRADIPFSVVMQRLEAETALFDLTEIQRRGSRPRVPSMSTTRSGLRRQTEWCRCRSTPALLNSWPELRNRHGKGRGPCSADGANKAPA